MQEDSEAAKDREAKKEMIYHTGNLYQRYKDRKKAARTVNKYARTGGGSA